MTRLLAQTRDVQIILPGREAPPSLLLWAGCLAALATLALLAVLVIRWRARRYDPAEAAFGKLARRAGLRRRERTALRALARAAGIDRPVALLVSPSALRSAALRSTDALTARAVERAALATP